MATSPRVPQSPGQRANPGGRLWDTLGQIDRSVYTWLSGDTTTRFDIVISRLTNTADNSKISIAMALALAAGGGRRGRRAALVGMASVAVTSAIANLVVKPLAQRARPNRLETHRDHLPGTVHYVSMPASHSFPSGHTAAACAFAIGVRSVWPRVAFVPAGAAVAVGYSRIHTGVHFPSDVLLGAVLGVALGAGTSKAIARA
ncbi:MAG: phosphatase PAP2 family protein [Candidatus Nanopelagicales bacterium]